MTWPDPTDVGDVYQPAEDSELLATAAVEHVRKGQRVLDVGTGSGYVAERLADAGARVVASDVNPHACRQASQRVPGRVVRADLTAPFRSDAFDAVTFNPPYLPTEADEEREDWMATALSGGPSGRAVIEHFLSDLPRVLAPEGVCLLLVSTLSGVEEVVELAADEGFSAVAVREESYPFETLSVLKLVR